MELAPLRRLRRGRALAEATQRAESAADSAAAGAAGLPRHLFVLVHGLSGLPTDLSCLKSALLRLSNRGAVVHLAEANVRHTRLLPQPWALQRCSAAAQLSAIWAAT